MTAPPDEIRAWLLKAQNDLASAQILIEHQPAIFDTACFHCQQAAEKTLKAFLVWSNLPFEKVHAMTYLIELCITQNQEFGSLREQAELLSPYAVEIRYPGDLLGIPEEDAEEAFAAAKAIWNLVLKQLPAELHP
jgi:HEPN domain-containing protein